MSREQKADKDYRYVLGKIDKLKLMEPLYRKTLTENEILKAKLGALEEKPSSSDKMSADVSITQHLLNSANIKDLEHPTEFFEVLDKEKQEEIELLKEKARNSRRNVEEIQQQKDRLKLQADDLTTQLTEKDRRLKELEETLFPATDEKDLSSSSRREREDALRGLRGLTPDDLSHPTTMQRRTVDDEELEETASLRRKIDELQQRVEELQNHNDKWEARCKELQQELSKVKCQLQQYQNAEISDRAKMMASLRDQQLRTEQAERMALAAKRQIDELERKVVDLETQLAEKERRRREQEQQDRINAKVEEVVREQTMLYVEQVKAFREDFEGEKRAHENTKTQLTSLTQQWRSVYDQLKDVNQQLSDANQRLETLKRENEKLEFQLEQARKDHLLIRNRLSEFGLMTLYDRFKASDSTATNDHSSGGPSTLSKWTCRKCTFINSGKSVNCEMCNESNKTEQFPQPLPEIPSYSSEKLSLTKFHLQEDGNYVNQSTFTKSNKDSSNKHALSQEDAHSQLTDDRNLISMDKKSS